MQSGTPLWKKLGLKEGSVLLMVKAPRSWRVSPLPDDVEVNRSTAFPSEARAGLLDADVVVAFFDSTAELRRSGPTLAVQLEPESSLWIAWPRKAAGRQSDITDQVVRDSLLPVGVVDTKVAALDADWSGLKFVWRLENRPSRG